MLVIDEPDDQLLLFNSVYRHFHSKFTKPLNVTDFLTFIGIFSKFHHEDQLEFLKIFEEFILTNSVEMIISDDYRGIYRLLALLSNHSGQYETKQLKKILAPFLIRLLISLTSSSSSSTLLFKNMANNNYEGKLERYTKILHRLIHKTISLLMQCIDYMKPYNWSILSIMDEPMSSIRNVLNEMIDMFLLAQINRNDDYDDDDDDDEEKPFTFENDIETYRLLFIIYIRLINDNILDRQKHLLPLLTTKRIRLYYYLCRRSIQYQSTELMNE